MKTPGQVAYEAWVHTSYVGNAKLTRSWETMTGNEKAAWENAARAVTLHYIRNRHDGDCPCC